MANCSCSGNSGSTYATATRSGYGCLSSVPTSSGIAYNCFLPPTNQAYYQNFPFYNGPCGTVAGENDSDNGNCNCCNTCCNTCCNPCNSGAESNCGSNNNCGCSSNCAMLCNCSCNPCCGPAAALVTSNGAVTTGVGGQVPVYMLAQASDSSLPLALASVVGPIAVANDSIIFNCTGTYLVTLSVHLPDTVTYNGTVGLVLNSAPVASSTQSIDVTTEAYSGTSQALVRVTEGATMTVNTSAALTATPDAGNIVTISIMRVA